MLSATEGQVLDQPVSCYLARIEATRHSVKQAEPDEVTAEARSHYVDDTL